MAFAASAERYSEHPLASAVREAAKAHSLPMGESDMFEAVPSFGVRAQVSGRRIAVGSRRMIAGEETFPSVDGLEAQGKTILYVACDDKPAGLLAVADTLRPEVPEALAALGRLGYDGSSCSPVIMNGLLLSLQNALVSSIAPTSFRKIRSLS